MHDNIVCNFTFHGESDCDPLPAFCCLLALLSVSLLDQIPGASLAYIVPRHIHQIGSMVRNARGASTARRGRSASSSLSAPPRPVNDTPDGVQHCVSCSKDVGEDAIGCDRCEHWVHNTEMCSGLPQRVLDAITEYDGRGINFVCTKCRILRESSASNNAQPLMMELVTQIFQQMKGLCSTVQNLVDQVKMISSKPLPASSSTPAPPPPPKPSQDEYKATIRKEILEMNERDKRRTSIIVKGLSASSPRDLAQKFSQISQEVMGVTASLTDVKLIPGHGNIFRAKIVDEDVRKQVLEKSKSLRGTEYSCVYISRDLTYAQRAELFARRQARRAEADTRVNEASSVPTPSLPPTVVKNAPTTSQGNFPPQ